MELSKNYLLPPESINARADQPRAKQKQATQTQ